jgi:hypothetical protein
MSDGDARFKLTSAGIDVNKANCTSAGQTDCTSLEGIQQATVDQMIALKDACGCSFTVTGGTEAGHAAGDASHSSGNKMDISLGSVDSYIQSTMTSIGNRSGDNAPQYQDKNGNIYAKEGNHWDILIVNSGSLPTRPQS